MSQGVLSGFPTCCLDAGLSGTESPFLLCDGGVSAWVLWLSFCASLDLLVVEGLVQYLGPLGLLFFHFLWSKRYLVISGLWASGPLWPLLSQF